MEKLIKLFFVGCVMVLLASCGKSGQNQDGNNKNIVKTEKPNSHEADERGIEPDEDEVGNFDELQVEDEMEIEVEDGEEVVGG